MTAVAGGTQLLKHRRIQLREPQLMRFLVVGVRMEQSVAQELALQVRDALLAHEAVCHHELYFVGEIAEIADVPLGVVRESLRYLMANHVLEPTRRAEGFAAGGYELGRAVACPDWRPRRPSWLRAALERAKRHVRKSRAARHFAELEAARA
jgi:hypothetical protein